MAGEVRPIAMGVGKIKFGIVVASILKNECFVLISSLLTQSFLLFD